jgi:glutamate 5-kinase
MNFFDHLVKEFAHSKEAFLHSINRLPETESIVINVGIGILSHKTGLLNIRSFKNFIRDIAELVNSNSKRRVVIVVSDSLEETKHQYMQPSMGFDNPSAASSLYSALISIVHSDIVNLFYDGFSNYNLRVIGFSVSSTETDITGELNKKLRTIEGIVSTNAKTDDIKISAIRDLLNAKKSAVRGSTFKARKTAETIKQLFRNFPRIIPIIMEDFSQKENPGEEDDGFAAKIALAINADAVVSISGKGMLYTVDPTKSVTAQKFYCYDTGRSTPFKNETRRAELATKLNAAKNLNARNKTIPMLLTSYNTPYTIRSLFDRTSIDRICVGGEYPTFTIFINSQKVELPIERQAVSGAVMVDKTAVSEILHTSHNLLSVGILRVYGEFKAKSVIAIQDEDGIEIGRGISRLSSNDIEAKVKQKGETVITRQKMVITAMDLRNDEVVFENAPKHKKNCN